MTLMTYERIAGFWVLNPFSAYYSVKPVWRWVWL